MRAGHAASTTGCACTACRCDGRRASRSGSRAAASSIASCAGPTASGITGTSSSHTTRERGPRHRPLRRCRSVRSASWPTRPVVRRDLRPIFDYRRRQIDRPGRRRAARGVSPSRSVAAPRPAAARPSGADARRPRPTGSSRCSASTTRLLDGRHRSGSRTQFMLECLPDVDRSLREPGQPLSSSARGPPSASCAALAPSSAPTRSTSARDVGPFARAARRARSSSALAGGGVELGRCTRACSSSTTRPRSAPAPATRTRCSRRFTALVGARPAGAVLPRPRALPARCRRASRSAGSRR